MTSDEDTEQASDSTLDVILREVARPPAPGVEALAHVRVPRGVELSAKTLMGAAVAGPREPVPGELLDERYELVRVLGRGGMGVVYAAENRRTGKAVAIKWISALRMGSPEHAGAVVERFRREARALAGVRHPNIVDVYDVGGSSEAPFLVMELLEGELLRERLSRGRCSWSEAAELLLPVMRGVAAVHRAGTIHRDLKPDNIFLCQSSAGVTPKVLDFGVAAIRGGSSDGLGTLTRSGTIVGTPSYMPLEQLTGGTVDERADVYALGVVLYEALSGALPFEARSASELAVLQATAAPTPLSAHCPELRGAREAAVMRALARKPQARYDSVDELVQAIELAGAPQRPRWPLWLLVVLVGSALVGGAALLRREPRAPDVARREPPAAPVGAAEPVRAAQVAEPEPVAPGEPAPVELTPVAPAEAAPPVRAPAARKLPRSEAEPPEKAPPPSPTELRFDEF